MQGLGSYDALLQKKKKKSSKNQLSQDNLQKINLKPADLVGVPIELLLHEEPQKRLQGIGILLKSYHPKTMRILNRLQEMELDPTVKIGISTAVHVYHLTSDGNSLDEAFALSAQENQEFASSRWQEQMLTVTDSILRHSDEEDMTEETPIVIEQEKTPKAELFKILLYHFSFGGLSCLNAGIAFFFFSAGFVPMALIFVLASLVALTGAILRSKS